MGRLFLIGPPGQHGGPYAKSARFPPVWVSADAVVSQVRRLAEVHGVTVQPTAWDVQADCLARLAGDQVDLDETERLVIALARAKVLTGPQMLRRIAALRGERHGV